jgi:hypothetical protein
MKIVHIFMYPDVLMLNIGLYVLLSLYTFRVIMYMCDLFIHDTVFSFFFRRTREGWKAIFLLSAFILFLANLII